MEDYKKKYEEAMLRMNKWVEGSEIIDPKEVAEFVFPELKESEDDRIRIAIIKSIKDLNTGWLELHGVTKKEALTWLEKQGEQKLIDKIQLGKKYKCIASPRYSTFMIGEIYKPEDKFLCSLMNFCSDCFEPIEDGKQIPAWSEEDENYCLDVNAAVSDYFDEGYAEELKDWLKSLKERYTWKPSDEQIKGIKCAIKTLQHQLNVGDKRLDSLYDDLKKLREE